MRERGFSALVYPMQHREIKLNVADIVVSLAIDRDVRISGHVDSFLADGPAEATVRVQIGARNGQSQVMCGSPISEHPGWIAHRTADRESVVVTRPGTGIQVRFATDRRCKVVDVLLRDTAPGSPDGGDWRRHELLLVEVLPMPVVVLLAGREGLFLHSCAVALEQQGLLFSGVSGSGKSTMADLWRQYGPSSSKVIDDEHILARKVGDRSWLYGAPWSRGARTATFSRTPLRTVFFLTHGNRNRCIALSSSEALAELLSQVFLPAWSRQQLDLVMQTCADLLQQADCYRLQFVPDQEVVRFVQDISGGCEKSA